MAERMLQFFESDHLAAPVQALAKQFDALAAQMVKDHAMSPERTVALRKLLEAKDAAARMVLELAKADA
jgi:homoserine kinase